MGTERNNYKIGIYLERALNDQGMSLKELSEKTGISFNLLRRYITNEKSPSLSYIKLISDALGKDIEYFTEDTFYKDGQMRAHILTYDLLVDFEKGNEGSVKKSYRALEKLMDQIFNSVTLEGQEKIVEKLYLFLTSDLYPIAYDEKNPDQSYWNWFFTDKNAMQQNLDINKKTIYQLLNMFTKDKGEEDEELKDLICSSIDKYEIQEELNKDK